MVCDYVLSWQGLHHIRGSLVGRHLRLSDSLYSGLARANPQMNSLCIRLRTSMVLWICPVPSTTLHFANAFTLIDSLALPYATVAQQTPRLMLSTFIPFGFTLRGTTAAFISRSYNLRPPNPTLTVWASAALRHWFWRLGYRLAKCGWLLVDIRRGRIVGCAHY